MRRRLAGVVVAALVGAACSPGGSSPPAATAVPATTTASTVVASTATASSRTSTTTAATTTTLAPVPPLALAPVPADGPARAVVTPTGVVAAVLGEAEGGWLVRLPCGGAGAVTGTPLRGAHVVLDPGHGGDEEGALGANGLTESELNLAVARQAAETLEAAGATVVLTRTADYRMTLQARAEVAVSLGALAFVSIHHNAVPDGPRASPGTETYFQVASPESRRLAGLLYEEVHAAFDHFEVAWVADSDAGAKYRLAGDGGDYYGILRRSAGVPAVLVEGAFLSNPAEAELLAGAAAQRAEATAVARAVARFLTTDDPGSGFVEPYPRTAPAGPGGGPAGCVDPPL